MLKPVIGVHGMVKEAMKLINLDHDVLIITKDDKESRQILDSIRTRLEHSNIPHVCIDEDRTIQLDNNTIFLVSQLQHQKIREEYKLVLYDERVEQDYLAHCKVKAGVA